MLMKCWKGKLQNRLRMQVELEQTPWKDWKHQRVVFEGPECRVRSDRR